MATDETYYLGADGPSLDLAHRIRSSMPGAIRARELPRLRLSDPSAVGARPLRGAGRAGVDEGFRKSLLATYNMIKHQVDSNLLSAPELPSNLSSEMRAVVRAAIALLGDQNGIQWMLSLQGREGASCIELLDLVVQLTQNSSQVQRRAANTLERLCSRVGQLPRSYIIPNTAVTMVSELPVAFGGFADVWRGRYKGQLVALKVFRLSESDDVRKVQKAFIREVLRWKNLCHRNILPLMGVMANAQFKFCMLSPWLDNGDILQYLNKKPDGKDANRLELLSGITSGVQFLHDSQTVHGDLKSANILVDSAGRACLADFGLVVVMRSLTTSHMISTTYAGKGTSRWMAPELLDPERFGVANDRHTKESDVYALGMVMLEIFSGRIPFPEILTEAQVIHKITSGERPSRPTDAARLGLSNSIWDLMGRCWQEEYRNRPDIATVVAVVTGEIRGAGKR